MPFSVNKLKPKPNPIFKHPIDHFINPDKQ